MKELLEQLDNCYVNLDISATEELKEKYNQLYDSFEDVCKSHRKWSVISYYHINRVIERSSAGTHINRKYAIFSTNPDLEIIRSAFNPLSIINSHVSIYLFPSFLLVKNRNDRFALIEFKDLYFHFDSDHFVEDGQVPKDAKVIDYAWLRSNKDGSPDLRFRDNYQIPICQYGRIDFQSAEGLNESFQISSYLHTKRFADCLERYMGEFV